MTEASPPAVALGPGSAPRRAPAFSPEAIFVLAGLSQNSGSLLAKSLFGEVEPATVAWFRVTFAAVVLLAFSWRQWIPRATSFRRWTRADLIASAVFGISIAAMNTCLLYTSDAADE